MKSQTCRAVVGLFVLSLARAEGDVTLSGLQHYLLNYQYRAVPTQIIGGNQQHFDGRINDRPIDFILDSGTDFTTVTSGCARRLKLKIQDTGTASIAAGGAEAGTTGEAAIASFVVGNSEISQPGVIHVLPASDDIAGADGLFGFDSLWLNSAILMVGGDGFLIRGGGRGNPPPLDGYLRVNGYTSVPLIVSNNRLLVAGSLNGRPLTAEIDCGAASSCFDLGYLKQIGVVTHWTLQMMGGLDGRAIPVRDFRPDAMTLGSYVAPRERMHAAISPLLTMGHIDVVLGFDFLRSRRAIVDLGSGVLWLK